MVCYCQQFHRYTSLSFNWSKQCTSSWKSNNITLYNSLLCRLPLSENIKDISDYLFFVVSDDGELLELYDEGRTLNAIQMFLPVLALKEPPDNEHNKKLVKDIGKSATIQSKFTLIAGLLLGNDLDRLEKCAMTEELSNFRIELFNNACQRADQERGIDGVVHYEFPEETILPNGKTIFVVVSIICIPVGDRCFSPNSHAELHEEDIEIMWFPNLPTDANQQAMQSLRTKVERSKNGLEVWYGDFEGADYDQPVGIRDIFEKTPSEIIKHVLLELDKVTS